MAQPCLYVGVFVRGVIVALMVFASLSALFRSTLRKGTAETRCSVSGKTGPDQLGRRPAPREPNTGPSPEQPGSPPPPAAHNRHTPSPREAPPHQDHPMRHFATACLLAKVATQATCQGTFPT